MFYNLYTCFGTCTCMHGSKLNNGILVFPNTPLSLGDSMCVLVTRSDIYFLVDKGRASLIIRNGLFGYTQVNDLLGPGMHTKI